MERKSEIKSEKVFSELDQEDEEKLTQLGRFLVDLAKRLKTQDEEKCRTYTVPEAAEIIGVCNKTAYNMITAGKLPVIRITDKKVVIPKRALDQWLEDAVQWPIKEES